MQRKEVKSILSNTGWLVLDRFVNLLSRAVLVFVVANHYGATEYGIYQYAYSIVLVLEIVVQLIDARVTKKRYREDNYDFVVYNATIAKIVLSVSVLLIGFGVIAIEGNSYPFSPIFIILIIDNIVKNIKFGMENRFEFLLKSKNVILASDSALIIGTILQIIAVFINTSILSISIIQLIATMIGLIILRVQYINAFTINKANNIISIHFIKEILIESLPLSLAAAAAMIYTKCDAIMLGKMLSTREVGIYSISANLIQAIQMLNLPIATTVYIKMLEWYKDGNNSIEEGHINNRYKQNYLRITSAVTWIAIVGILLSFVVLPAIFHFLKDEYLPAMNTYKILSIGSLAVYNATLRASHLTIVKGGRSLMRIQWLAVVMNIILNYELISFLGMNGAAIATASCQVLSLLVLNALFDETKFCLKIQLKALNPKYAFQLLKGIRSL